MNEQKALFPFEDSGDRNFEYKRAKKQALRGVLVRLQSRAVRNDESWFAIDYESLAVAA